MSHHAIAYHYQLLEAFKYLTELFRRIPPHIAVAWHKRGIEADTSAACERPQEGFPIWTQWRESLVQRKGGDTALRVVAVGVVGECIGDVRQAVLRK